MSERNDVARSREAASAAEVGQRVTAVLEAAEAAAGAIRSEAEQQAQATRRTAEADARRYADERRREADDLLEQRLRRISEVSDGLVERAEAVASQLDEAELVKRQVQTLVSALGEAAEQLAGEVSQEGGGRPALSVVTDETAQVEAEPEPAPAEPEPEPAVAPRKAEPAAKSDSGELSPLERLKAAAGRPEGEDEPAPERRGRFDRGEEEGEAELQPAEDHLLAARLVALQMAVAGSVREDVERQLVEEFKVEDPGTILDEVFGRAT